MTKISLYVKESFVNGRASASICCRVAGSPRAMRLVMVLIAAQRIMASKAVLAFGFAHDVHHGGEDGAGPIN
jgi:hypothetical protein